MAIDKGFLLIFLSLTSFNKVLTRCGGCYKAVAWA